MNGNLGFKHMKRKAGIAEKVKEREVVALKDSRF